MSGSVERRLGLLMLVGMLTLPGLFCWLFLRRGYARSLRRTAFFFAAVVTGIGVLGRLAR